MADIINGGEVGNAVLDVEGLLTQGCPTSTVIGAAILNSVVGSAIEELLSMGIAPHVLVSSNVNGSQNARGGLSNPAGTSHEMD